MGGLMHRNKSTILLCAIGYTFHLVVISLIGWNGTLLFLPEFADAENVLYWFNATQLIAFPVTFFIGALASQKWAIECHAKVLALAATFFSAAGVAVLFACLSQGDAKSIGLFASLAGLLTGTGNSMFFLSWQNVLAVQDDSSIGIELTIGTGAAGAIYLVVIQSKPEWLPLAVLVVAFVANVVLLVLSIDATKAGEPGSCAPKARKKEFAQLFDKLWQPALCIASLALARGIAPALVLDDPVYGSTLSTLMTFGRLASAVLFFVLWRKYSPNMSFWTDRLYSIAVVLVATGFVLLPLFGKEYQFVFAIAAYTIFSVASLFMMFLCAAAARSCGIRPLTVYGLFGGFVYAFSRAGFATTYFAHMQVELGVVQLLMVALVSVYILLLIYFVSRRKQGVALGRRGQDIESAPDSGALASWLSDADSASMMDSDDEPDEPASIVLSVKDALHDRCSAMTEESGLSAREAEIMEYLALGRSVPYIAEALYISENTVRTHCKSIYRKLGIHSKSELMDLVDNSKTLS